MPLSLQPETPAALLCAIMAGDEPAIEAVVDLLQARFGTVRDRSATYSFDAFSSYYAPEMGEGLRKCVVCFGDPVPPSSLVEVKRATLQIEGEHARNSGSGLRRTVNIDPGMLSPQSLVLATTKASAHRVSIAPSLSAEVTLLFEKGAYRPLPWSYRDYQSPPVQTFLLRLRRALIAAARGRR